MGCAALALKYSAKRRGLKDESYTVRYHTKTDPCIDRCAPEHSLNKQKVGQIASART